MDCALQVDHLCKDYGNFQLKNVGFALPKGGIMGLIGENGAGKTTTIKLILGLIQKDGGSVRIFGKDPETDARSVRQDIGVVLDESAFHENLKLADIRRVMGSIFGNWSDETFTRFTKRFGLPENKIVKEFSRGMKAKLSIAAALSHDPKLLILDEATGGLDPVVRAEILDIFLELIQDENRSVLISTHITSDLEKIADYITLLHDGSVVFSRTKDDIQADFGILRCGASDFARIASNDIVRYRQSRFGYEMLVSNKAKVRANYRDLVLDPASLEDIMLFYAKGESK